MFRELFSERGPTHREIFQIVQFRLKSAVFESHKVDDSILLGRIRYSNSDPFHVEFDFRQRNPEGELFEDVRRQRGIIVPDYEPWRRKWRMPRFVTRKNLEDAVGQIEGKSRLPHGQQVIHEGFITMGPSRENIAETLIKLNLPSGDKVTVSCAAVDLREFLDETKKMVPFGRENQRLVPGQVDQELSDLLNNEEI